MRPWFKPLLGRVRLGMIAKTCKINHHDTNMDCEKEMKIKIGFLFVSLDPEGQPQGRKHYVLDRHGRTNGR